MTRNTFLIVSKEKFSYDYIIIPQLDYLTLKSDVVYGINSCVSQGNSQTFPPEMLIKDISQLLVNQFGFLIEFFF